MAGLRAGCERGRLGPDSLRAETIVLVSRTGEAIAVTARPEVVIRSGPVVEELWDSASHRYLMDLLFCRGDGDLRPYVPV